MDINAVAGLFPKYGASKPPNLVFVITDQQRSRFCWPTDFRATLLDAQPALKTLIAHGVSFDANFTAAAMCTASRGALLTSKYPPETGITTTGKDVLPSPGMTLPTLVSVLEAAGYGVAQIEWRGKWHLFGAEEPGTAELMADAGFQDWVAPDAGISTSAEWMGGGTPGTPDHNGNDPNYLEQALAMLQSSPSRPFALVVSFVNPHDICAGNEILPSSLGPDPSDPRRDPTFGYEQTTIEVNGQTVPLLGGIPGSPAPIPANAGSLSGPDCTARQHKPRAQQSSAFRWTSYWPSESSGTATEQQQAYLNFYVGLQVLVDNQIQQILNVIQGIDQPGGAGPIDDTVVIRFADHGEMGVSHTLVEKFYVPYDEAIHVPMVWSNLGGPANPVPGNVRTTHLTSLVDLVPTLASLLQVDTTGMDFRGVDYSALLLDPAAGPVQDAVHFVYDDIPGPGPSHIRTIRTPEWKYSVYFESDGSDSDYELYDLVRDPSEDCNLAGVDGYQAIVDGFDTALQDLMQACRTAPSIPTQATQGDVPQFDFWPPTVTSGSCGVSSDGAGPSDATGDTTFDGLLDRLDPLAAKLSKDEKSAIAALQAYLEGADDRDAVAAAHLLARIGTPAARAAMNGGLYRPVRSPRVMKAIHSAWARFNG